MPDVETGSLQIALVEMSAHVLSCFIGVQLFATPWTVARGLLCPWDSPGKNTELGPRQKYWSGLQCPPPGDLPDSQIDVYCTVLFG